METVASQGKNSTNNNEKIVKVLQKFLDPDFKIRNDVYLNLFLTHLIGEEGTDKIWQKDQQLQEEFCQWIIKAAALWDQHKVKSQATILSFGLNLASQMSADEQIFVKLNCQNVYEGLVGVAQTNLTKDPSVTLGLVTLLCSFLEHKSGLQWVMATTFWTDMINLGLTAHTLYIKKKTYQFLIKLLEKTISFNKNFSVHLVSILIKPLNDVFRSLPSNNDAQQTQIEDRQLFESLKPSMDLILGTVEPLVKTCSKNVVDMFLEQEILETVDKFLLLSRSEEFTYELLRIQFAFLFYKLILKVEGRKVVAYDAISLISSKVMFDSIRKEMEKHNIRCVVKICDYAHEMFCCLAPLMPIVIKNGVIIEFQMQMMFIQIAPIFSLTIQMVSKEVALQRLLKDVFRNTFFHKWLTLGSVQIIEICHKFVKDLTTEEDLVEDVIFCVQYVARMKRYVNKERISNIFPALVYTLMDSINNLRDNPLFEIKPSWIVYLKTVIETIIDLMESFDLTWKDTIQTICVLDLAYDFLHSAFCTDNRVISKGLKLLNVAISKHMSPDMALLIYHKENSKVALTGSLLYVKCHDSSWEVRDSAMEVVHTLSLNANSKFPAFTTILLNAELPQLVVKMAIKDGEYYVRATAFKCLQELIQIQEVWEILVKTDKFLDNILDVFENETEGIVRKEVATLIYKIDKFQEFSEDILPRVYDVMTHAAVGDLHWEVKYNALDFWFNLWEHHLARQGMIDNSFPSHTFSMEHKKIVALNEVEVRKRIIKVLNQLSQVGCLYVMKSAVEDDCDIEVSKRATSATLNFLKLFKFYKITSENVDQKDLPKQQFIEPISPATSGPNSASITDLDGPEFSNSPFFDPVSPYSAPYSPSVELGLLTPISAGSRSTSSTNYSSPQQNQVVYGKSDNIQAVAVQDTVSSPAPSDTSVRHISPSIGLTNGMDLFDYEDVDFDNTQLENIINSNSFHPVRTEQMLDEFLKSNDMTLLQKIYHPTDQVTNNTTKMKTKEYLAPSEYLRFVYKEVESYAVEKTQWMNRLDEFDSLLDDILKEYNVVADVNSMDCY